MKRIIPILFACFFGMLLLGACASRVRLGNINIAADATEADFRGETLSCAEYDALKAQLPACSIRWSVPVGETSADSESETLALPALSERVIDALSYLPKLTRVTLETPPDAALLARAHSEYPDLAFSWSVTVGGKTFACDAESVDLTNASVTSEALFAAFSALPALKTADLSGASVTPEEVFALQDAFPSIRISYSLELCGKSFSLDQTGLDLTDAPAFDFTALSTELKRFTALATVDLTGCALTNEEKATLVNAYPNVFFLYDVVFPFGLTVQSDVSELDLSAYHVDDPVALTDLLLLLPKLTYLDMCRCGPSNEEMAVLRDALPNVKVVWMINLKYWEMRTDITAFSMGYRYKTPFPNGKGRYLTDSKFSYQRISAADIEPLQYCTDLVALDMGHAIKIKDISVLKNLTKIKYLVIALMDLKDISVLENLPELEYLEVFYNYVSDEQMQVLLKLKNLRFLNCGGNDFTSIDVLKQLTGLERLWVNLIPFTDAQIAELESALPNTLLCIKPNQDPGRLGWPKDNRGYLEMRELFGMKPQGQG